MKHLSLSPLLTLLALLAGAETAAGSLYSVPGAGEDLVGQPQLTTAAEEDTLVQIGRRYGTGYGAIRAVNPLVDAWLPGEGTEVMLPTWHILPQAKREGIVINTAEMRLYHYQSTAGDGPSEVGVYAISIGRQGRQTPLATAKVTRKARNPSWYPPESIRRDRAALGETLPTRVPPGPDNPLGSHALYLNLPAYLIHGTNRPLGIGMEVTNGCVRMYPEDIEYIYERVPVGSTVQIVHQPVKVGWSDDVLYAEVHAPLEWEQVGIEQRLQQARAAIAAAISDHPGFSVSWNQVEVAVLESSGLPVAVGPAWRVEADEQPAADDAARSHHEAAWR
ncbi:L,D-transpeptidase family protein [Kineobactrum salinum]|uniref:L,D-transpeptidase family protein n=1 Tax=Kineobactrum salinum TaxID=2708301 RepID=A0A6C0U9E1_9GAMM|nr:L,D-transpeptidase family protein [Kineobactrum salinum]QIB67255.1 L,D-transpeptidase family protein [Kineobactrum salinum]